MLTDRDNQRSMFKLYEKSEHPRSVFLKDMEATAAAGDLDALLEQLEQWQSQIDEYGVPAMQSDRAWYMPEPFTFHDVYESLGSRFGYDISVDTYSFVLNKLLVSAVTEHRVEVVEYLLKREECPLSMNAVVKAINRDFYDLLELFLAHGWDIDRPPVLGGSSLLRWFIRNEKRVRWLLEHGADPNAGNRVLGPAGQLAPINILKLLAEYGADFENSNALHGAAKGKKTGRIEVMQWLLDEVHVPINHQDVHSRKETALHVAVRYNYLEGLAFLLDRGIDVNIRDSYGATAMDWARQEGYLDALKTLLSEPLQRALRGKAALVIDACSEIGSLVAIELAEARARVVCAEFRTSSRPQAFRAVTIITLNGGIATSIWADPRKSDQVKKAIEYTIHLFGRLDIICYPRSFGHLGKGGVIINIGVLSGTTLPEVLSHYKDFQDSVNFSVQAAVKDYTNAGIKVWSIIHTNTEDHILDVTVSRLAQIVRELPTTNDPNRSGGNIRIGRVLWTGSGGRWQVKSTEEVSPNK
ncbi:ankyrin repeat-containing domain protein [Aspergillus avenaceus]|uniref:Ankyrin repeat-containing domain protein n=1 Tax=Aspergillus avenaceus TaxID=36643 RepID=A0A5N6TWB1_ASPAV|nr:ankyrin repeat-containing domain protein [Aspergillus avenaceus]